MARTLIDAIIDRAEARVLRMPVAERRAAERLAHIAAAPESLMSRNGWVDDDTYRRAHEARRALNALLGRHTERHPWPTGVAEAAGLWPFNRRP